MRFCNHFLLFFLLLILSPSDAEAFSLFFWKKRSTWVKDYMVKQGVQPAMADAALKGLSDDQLLKMTRLEAKILAKLLKALQKTLDETTGLISAFGPLEQLNDKQSAQLSQASLLIASSMRRSVDVVFDAMEGKVPDHHVWKKSMHNTHHFVLDTVCDRMKNREPWFCVDGKKAFDFHWSLKDYVKGLAHHQSKEESEL